MLNLLSDTTIGSNCSLCRPREYLLGPLAQELAALAAWEMLGWSRQRILGGYGRWEE